MTYFKVDFSGWENANHFMPGRPIGHFWNLFQTWKGYVPKMSGSLFHTSCSQVY